MSRYLVLANQTLCGTSLEAALCDRINRQDCDLYFVVPATPQSNGHIPERIRQRWNQSGTAYEEGRRLATGRLAEALGHYQDLGARKVDGAVYHSDPMIAMSDALGTESGFTEFIISTPPRTVSRWVHLDLVHRVHRHYGIRVVRVESAATLAAERLP